jgi:predicted DNA-binding transcriptional regulator AlpA
LPAETPTADAPILLDARGVCARLSIGLSHFHALKSDGRFPLTPIRLGRAVRWDLRDVAAWIDAKCPNEYRWRAMRQMSGRGIA